MKRLLVLLLLAAASTVAAQDRSAELDKAYEETRAAYISCSSYGAALQRWNDLK